MKPIRSVAVLTAVVVAMAACTAEDPATSDPSPQATLPPASTNPPTPQSTEKKPASKPGEKEQARLDQQLINAAWDKLGGSAGLHCVEPAAARGCECQGQHRAERLPHLHE